MLYAAGLLAEVAPAAAFGLAMNGLKAAGGKDAQRSAG